MNPQLIDRLAEAGFNAFSEAGRRLVRPLSVGTEATMWEAAAKVVAVLMVEECAQAMELGDTKTLHHVDGREPTTYVRAPDPAAASFLRRKFGLTVNLREVAEQVIAEELAKSAAARRPFEGLDHLIHRPAGMPPWTSAGPRQPDEQTPVTKKPKGRGWAFIHEGQEITIQSLTQQVAAECARIAETAEGETVCLDAYSRQARIQRDASAKAIRERFGIAEGS